MYYTVSTCKYVSIHTIHTVQIDPIVLSIVEHIHTYTKEMLRALAVAGARLGPQLRPAVACFHASPAWLRQAALEEKRKKRAEKRAELAAAAAASSDNLVDTSFLTDDIQTKIAVDAGKAMDANDDDDGAMGEYTPYRPGFQLPRRPAARTAESYCRVTHPASPRAPRLFRQLGGATC